ncbi:hypothetical protein [Lentibacillus daqui]|nr:hypothetical protein [Lentibacillus daqui]
MNAVKLSDLIEYLKALAKLKYAGHHVTLEIKSTMDAIESEIHS